MLSKSNQHQGTTHRATWDYQPKLLSPTIFSISLLLHIHNPPNIQTNTQVQELHTLKQFVSSINHNSHPSKLILHHTTLSCKTCTTKGNLFNHEPPFPFILWGVFIISLLIHLSHNYHSDPPLPYLVQLKFTSWGILFNILNLLNMSTFTLTSQLQSPLPLWMGMELGYQQSPMAQLKAKNQDERDNTTSTHV